MRETMALRATEEPRLMREIVMPQRKETMTAFRGMGKEGETWSGVSVGRDSHPTGFCFADEGDCRGVDTHLGEKG